MFAFTSLYHGFLACQWNYSSPIIFVHIFGMNSEAWKNCAHSAKAGRAAVLIVAQPVAMTTNSGHLWRASQINPWQTISVTVKFSQLFVTSPLLAKNHPQFCSSFYDRMGHNDSQLTCPFTSNLDVDKEQKDTSCCLQKQYHGQGLVCETVMAPHSTNQSGPDEISFAAPMRQTIRL